MQRLPLVRAQQNSASNPLDEKLQKFGAAAAATLISASIFVSGGKSSYSSNSTEIRKVFDLESYHCHKISKFCSNNDCVTVPSMNLE